jgi:hypothetical protein
MHAKQALDEFIIWRNSPPINMAITEKIFSAFVFAETFPNPTLVKLVHVK